MLQALVFDVDGTLADTESTHRAAFNHAFSEEGLDWVWDEALYTELLEISGGKERIAHYWKRTRGGIVGIDAYALQDTIARLHELKTAAYEGMVNDGQVSLRRSISPPSCAKPLVRTGARSLAWWKTPPQRPSKNRTRRSICKRCNAWGWQARTVLPLRIRATASKPQWLRVCPR